MREWSDLFELRGRCRKLRKHLLDCFFVDRMDDVGVDAGRKHVRTNLVYGMEGRRALLTQPRDEEQIRAP